MEKNDTLFYNLHIMSTEHAHTPGPSLRLVTPQESHGAHVENYDIADLLTEPSKGLPEVD